MTFSVCLLVVFLRVVSSPGFSGREGLRLDAGREAERGGGRGGLYMPRAPSRAGRRRAAADPGWAFLRTFRDVFWEGKLRKTLLASDRIRGH